MKNKLTKDDIDDLKSLIEDLKKEETSKDDVLEIAKIMMEIIEPPVCEIKRMF